MKPIVESMPIPYKECRDEQERELWRQLYYHKCHNYKWSWQPILILYEDTSLDPLLVWDGEFIRLYGNEYDAVMLAKEPINQGYIITGKDEVNPTDWVEQSHTCGEPDGIYKVLPNFRPTHFILWPEPPNKYKLC